MQQLVGFRHTGAFLDGAHADVHFHEVVERYIGLLRFGFPVLELVLLFDACKAVKLRLDCIILDFIKEQFGLSEFGTCGHDVGATEVVPFNVVNAEHFR